ncbi:MAG: ATP-binding protein [Bacteroidota bacterium]
MKNSKVYLRATVIAVLLIICNQIFIQYWLFQKREDALLINRGGRQRMLSQRILVKAMLYHDEPSATAYQELQATIEDWRQSQQFLLNRLEEGAVVYHERQNKERLTDLASYIEAAAQLTAQEKVTHQQLKDLEKNQEKFLAEMDQLVGTLQEDSDQKLKMVVTIEIIFALLSLFLIYYEITFVFKKINLRLRSKNEDLEESNELLEQYAYLASHDLRAPIQNIINFSGLMMRRTKSKLSKDELSFLDYILEASHRLKRTTSDLLKVATIQHHELHLKWCSPKQIIEEVLEDLEDQVISTKAQITIQDLPEGIKVDQHIIHLSFQNLIANSLKFTREGQLPKIDISYTQTGQDHIFMVKDEGIGISPDEQANIFKLFSRANQEGQYDGAGIGLAICQRMIRRLNGNIEIDSQVGQGCTFKITIPKEIAHNDVLSIY